MSKWEKVLLKDITISTNTGLDAIKRAPIVEKETGIKCLRIQDISQKKIFNKWGNTELTAENFEKFRLREGEIIMARTCSTGLNLYIKNDLPAVFNNGLVRIRVNKEKANPKFLYYLFMSKDFIGHIDSISGGTSVQLNMQIGDLLSYEFLLPSLLEQKAIADVLSSLDDKIDLLQRNNLTLEQLAESLFRQWFVVEAEEDTNEISLSDISKHVKKSVNPSKTPDQFFKHYSLPAFDNGRNPEIQLGRDILSNKYQISPGQILISKLNPRTPRVWFIYSCNNYSICSTEFQVYEPIKKEYTEFIYCLLKSNDTRDILTGASSGTSGSHQRVSPEDINKLTIKKPNEERIIQFHQIASVWLNKVDKNSIQIQQLETLRDTLLPKLMSGIVRVEN